jgi:hypothetical protein
MLSIPQQCFCSLLLSALQQLGHLLQPHFQQWSLAQTHPLDVFRTPFVVCLLQVTASLSIQQQ